MKQLLKRLSKLSNSSRHRVPHGHVPLLVGDGMERFVVPAHLLSRPAFLELLQLSAHEYGYDQHGVLRIPCPIPIFLRALAVSTDESDDEEIFMREIARYRSAAELVTRHS